MTGKYSLESIKHPEAWAKNNAHDNQVTIGSWPRWCVGNLPKHLFACISMAVLVFTITGCRVVGPDFSGAPIPEIGQDFHASSTLNGVPQADPTTFWSSFSDPILDQLVAQSLDQNLTVRQAAERIIEARANVSLNGGQLYPNVNSNSGYAFSKRSPNAQPFVGVNGRSFSLFSNGFDSNWEIDLFGRIERSIEAAEAELEAQHATLADVQQTLTADVATSYFTIRLLQEQITLIEHSIELQQSTAALVDGRTNAGISTELDREQTNAFLHRSNAQVAALRQQLNLEYNRLSLLLGETASQELRAFVGFRGVPESTLAPLMGIPSDLLRRRPDVRKAESLVHAACARIGVAEADLYPSLSLIGSISLSAKDASQLFQSDSMAFALGPSVKWNILHFGRIFDNIEIHESRMRQTLAAYQQAVLSAVKEVEDSLIQYDGFQRQLVAIDRARQADAKAVELSLGRYKAGKANFQRVLDTQLQLLQDSQGVAAARANSIIQLVRLYKATGGGWPGRTSDPSDLIANFSGVEQIQEFPTPAVQHSNAPTEAPRKNTNEPPTEPNREPPTRWFEEGSTDFFLDRWQQQVPVERQSQRQTLDAAAFGGRYPLGHSLTERRSSRPKRPRVQQTANRSLGTTSATELATGVAPSRSPSDRYPILKAGGPLPIHGSVRQAASQGNAMPTNKAGADRQVKQAFEATPWELSKPNQQHKPSPSQHRTSSIWESETVTRTSTSDKRPSATSFR